jgi:4-aminobutyrate aminotransferase/(S)-3-amino-2-methylpropionate transaminase
VGSAAVMDAWPVSDGEALHTSTFLGHPLACAAALAALDRYAPERVLERVRSTGERLLGRLSRRLSDSRGVAEVRGLGLLLGIELGGIGGRAGEGMGARAAVAALERGVIVLPAGDVGQVVELTPAVTLSEEQADHAVEALASAIEEVCR